MILVSDGEGHGQFTRRIGLTGQDISDTVPTLLSCLPGTKNCVGLIVPGSSFNGTAHIQRDYGLFADCVERIANIFDQRNIIGRKVEIG